jgi:ADP-ribose pyrophosphatase YjhB (NUDIX family)
MSERPPDPQWLAWAKQLQTIAQTGLTYVRDPYDRERYEQVREIALEMLAAGSGLPMPEARGLFAGETGHATPKVDVRGVVFQGDTILLVRERSDGGWTLPGGWADPGEAPSVATVREVYEESGYRTRAIKLLALYDRDLHGHGPHPYHIYKVFFQCEIDESAAETQHAPDSPS